jgi:hypothetical protein
MDCCLRPPSRVGGYKMGVIAIVDELSTIKKQGGIYPPDSRIPGDGAVTRSLCRVEPDTRCC